MFKFSQRSWERLAGVHPDLVFILEQAITNSPIDFGVTEGLRSLERQEWLVRKKLSQTMNSKHLKQEDGWGHAVDLVPYVDGKASWSWDHIIQMASAIQTTVVVNQPMVPAIRWGGAWTSLNTTRSVKDLKDGYVDRCRKAGRTPFLDGPHFEILKK